MIEYILLYLSAVVVTFVIGPFIYGLHEMIDNLDLTFGATVLVYILFVVLTLLFPTRPI